MQSFRIGHVAVATFMAIILVACGGSGKWRGSTQDEDVRGKLMATRAKLAEKGILSAVATATSSDLQMAIDKVELDARGQLARALESKIESMQKQFKEEAADEDLSTFSSVTKSVSSTVLSATSLIEAPYRQGKDKRYEVHGLMILDSKLFRDAIAQQLASNQALKSRWQASKTFEELDKEVKALEEFKKEQSR